MNYTKIYNNIIINAKELNRSKKSEYLESHHIIPKSIGGTDDKENLVLLTAKEHFICHHLLTKICKNNNKLHSAFWMMFVCESSNQQRYKKFTSVTYQLAKQNRAKIQSDYWKIKTNNPNNYRSNKGENNPMFGSCRTGETNPFFGKQHTHETKLDLSRKIKEYYSNNANPTTNSIWINNGIKNKRINSESQIPEGFVSGQIKLQCPYCMLTGGTQNMKRYHFENCKSKYSV
jgi:hypothetical protein